MKDADVFEGGQRREFRKVLAGIVRAINSRHPSTAVRPMLARLDELVVEFHRGRHFELGLILALVRTLVRHGREDDALAVLIDMTADLGQPTPQASRN